MGGALLKGWTSQRIGPIAAIEPAPSSELLAFARQNHVRLLRNVDEAAGLPIGTCVVALKPQILRTEARHLTPIAKSGALMVSIAAGTSIAALRNSWGPRARIIRAMPNLPGAIGRGISALYAPRGTTASAKALAESLLTSLGETLWVSREELIDVVTAVSGSGPAYVFLFAECLANAARAEGLSVEIAQRLARATLSGAGALLDADPQSPEALRRAVTSPGGTTEAALKLLMRDDALARLIDESVAAARARAAELRRQSET